MKKTILFVDCDEDILKSLRKLVSDTNYIVYLARSGEEALEILNNNRIDLIMADINLAKMNGYDLLIQVKKKHPKVFRVILSGNKEEALIIKAIQKNIAKLFIYKPWDNRHLLNILNGIFEFQNKISSPELINIINNLEGLPTLPNLYNQLCQAIYDDENIENIASIIQKDHVVAAQVLHVANSAFYGIKTSSISQAIMNIGLNNIKNIVLATSVFNINLPTSRMNTFERLWNHAYLCNQLTNMLYMRIFDKKIPVEYLSAGLLHDIGKIILISIFGNEYYKLLDSKDFYSKEIEEIGITHQQIGGYFLDWWELPMPVIESVLYHHEPLNANIVNKNLLSVVHLADYYAHKENSNQLDKNLDKEVFTYLGISKERVDRYINEKDLIGN